MTLPEACAAPWRKLQRAARHSASERSPSSARPVTTGSTYSSARRTTSPDAIALWAPVAWSTWKYLGRHRFSILLHRAALAGYSARLHPHAAVQQSHDLADGPEE